VPTTPSENIVSIGPLIANIVKCASNYFQQSGSTRPVGTVRVWRRGDRGWHMVANSVLHRSVFVGKSQRSDAIAGVMVLSEVARRLMMISGSSASTCATGYGRAATSRLTEVTTITVPAGHRQPSAPGQELQDTFKLILRGPSRTLCELHSPDLEGGPFFGPPRTGKFGQAGHPIEILCQLRQFPQIGCAEV